MTNYCTFISTNSSWLPRGMELSFYQFKNLHVYASTWIK